MGPVVLISLSASGRRANGTRFAVSGENQHNPNTKTLQLGVSNSPVVSYKVVVAASKNFGVQVQALQHGDF